jgi:hypothetical protein
MQHVKPRKEAEPDRLRGQQKKALEIRGQSIFPWFNWGLYLGCVALVLAFGSSSALAAAYGFAVAGVMLLQGALRIPGQNCRLIAGL